MDEEKKQKLRELNEKYRQKLRKLQKRSLDITSEFLRKADEHKADKILSKLKEANGRDT